MDDVKLMRSTFSTVTGVKASGGVHSLVDLNALKEAGATRLVVSSGGAIMNGL